MRHDSVMTGSLPTEMGLLVEKNQFTSSLPAELEMLRNLKALRLNNNKLTGTLPSFLSLWRTCAPLSNLQLQSNYLGDSTTNPSQDR